MQSLDYHSVIGHGSPSSEDEIAFVLRLGSVELEPISYSTLIGLKDRPDVMCEVLEVCFIDRSVMWAHPADVESDSLRARLSEVEAQLLGLDFRLKASQQPRDQVLARIVELWHGLTREAVARLEQGEASDVALAPRSVVADYRRGVCAYVEALVQLLPEGSDCSIQACAKLELARTHLIQTLGIEEGLIEHAGWRVEVREPEESGFVTWGIP